MNQIFRDYQATFQQYATFSGRASRREYWTFTLVNWAISFLLGLLTPSGEVGWFSVIFSLATFLPQLAAAVRRMHDVGKSGWFILIPIYNIILLLTEGDRGQNDYGQDPMNPELNYEDQIDEIGRNDL